MAEVAGHTGLGRLGIARQHHIEQFHMLLGGGQQLVAFIETGEAIEAGALAQLADGLDEAVIATEAEQFEVEAAVGLQIADEVMRPGRRDDLQRGRAEGLQLGPVEAVRVTWPTTGTSIRARISVYWSRSRSLTSVIRKPLLRTGSTSPSRARSSIASRTGVAETPKSAARPGAE